LVVEETYQLKRYVTNYQFFLGVAIFLFIPKAATQLVRNFWIGAGRRKRSFFELSVKVWFGVVVDGGMSLIQEFGSNFWSKNDAEEIR